MCPHLTYARGDTGAECPRPPGLLASSSWPSQSPLPHQNLSTLASAPGRARGQDGKGLVTPKPPLPAPTCWRHSVHFPFPLRARGRRAQGGILPDGSEVAKPLPWAALWLSLGENGEKNTSWRNDFNLPPPSIPLSRSSFPRVI